ncbi:MAG: WG repeat-containing protein [Flammeovirgaceae bacterium]|nr:WG repeat-containing protein [Flammeovirgaceae bacterium]
MRDEVAFLDALKINTYTVYEAYFQKYPQSHRAQEAKKRYEKLLFEDKTSDKKLSSYKLFFEQYPSSPYRMEVQREIFQLMTANGEPETFFQYLKEYPQGEYAKNARDILYHLFKETDEKIPASIESDSLLQVINLGTKFWIPFYKNGLYGFMDQDGEEVLPPRFEEIEEEYKCGPVKNDILIFKAGVFSRNGSKLLDAGTEVTNIGWGFLIAEHEGCKQLMHKSGTLIISACYDDFKVVGNNFIAAKKQTPGVCSHLWEDCCR